MERDFRFLKWATEATGEEEGSLRSLPLSFAQIFLLLFFFFVATSVVLGLVSSFDRAMTTLLSHDSRKAARTRACGEWGNIERVID